MGHNGSFIVSGACMPDSPDSGPCQLRFARPGDEAVVLALIGELAEYERLADTVVATEADLTRCLFGERPAAEVRLAEVDGEVAGFALFFHNFSTFTGRPGLYLEDLYVRPAWRGLGIGYRLLCDLAGLARKRGCARMEWVVLDWNGTALDFYHRLGARTMDDWIVCRLDGEALAALGQRQAARGALEQPHAPVGRKGESCPERRLKAVRSSLNVGFQLRNTQSACVVCQEHGKERVLR